MCDVLDGSSMLPCSGKGHSHSHASLFLSFLFHVQSGAAQGDDDVYSVTLTIATTLMENAFEIEEGGVKDGRIWRETEGNRGRGG